MAGGAVNTFRQLGYALGIALFGTVLTSRMQDTLPADAAHTLAGGGAGAPRDVFGEGVLRAAFADGHAGPRAGQEADRDQGQGDTSGHSHADRGGDGGSQGMT